MTVGAVAIGVLWSPLVILCGGLIWVVFMAFRGFGDPAEFDFSKVEESLGTLLRHGYERGYLTIRHKESGRAILFKKYFDADGGYGLAMTVPENWEQDDIGTLQDYCDAQGLEIVERERREEHTPVTLLIDCSRDVERAYALALAVWTGVFELPEDAAHEFETGGVVQFDTLIDSPDHPRLSDSEVEQRRHRAMREYWQKLKRIRLQSAQVGVGRWMLFGFAAIPAIFGLPIATLLSLGDTPDWSVALGTVTAAGSTSSAVFLAIYVAAFVAGPFFSEPSIGPPSNFEASIAGKIYFATRRFAFRALPVAVILIWFGA